MVKIVATQGFNSMLSRAKKPCVQRIFDLCNHSHSIVAGGLEVTSSTTRFTPRTSLQMRFAVNIVADSIARQIEGRASYRRAIKMAIASTMRIGLLKLC